VAIGHGLIVSHLGHNHDDHEGGNRPALRILGAQADEGQDEADAPGIANKDKDEAK